MTDKNAPIVRYSVLGKTFHWAFVALFAYGIYKQVDDISTLTDGALLRFEVIFARKLKRATKTRIKNCPLWDVYIHGNDRWLWVDYWRSLHTVWS